MIQLSKRSGALIGLIIFCIPLAFFLLWVHACNQTSGYPENVNFYNRYFPEFLTGRFTTTILSVVLCIIAISLNVRNLKDSNTSRRIVSWFVVIAGGLLSFLNLFSMM
jgi:uncharacterized membrane protein YhaH (DUF805 family)